MKSIWIDGGDDGLINLNRFDRVLMNGSAGGKTHWLEVERMIGPDSDDESSRISHTFRFCDSMDDCWAKYESLIAQLRAAGVIVIDAQLTEAEQGAAPDLLQPHVSALSGCEDVKGG